MPYRRLAANELGAFLDVIAQPRRIQIIEEIRGGEKDVGTLARALGLSSSNVSQHLAVLRAWRVVTERREGRRILYHLSSQKLAAWLLEGLQFLPALSQEADQVKQALSSAQEYWSAPEDGESSPR